MWYESQSLFRKLFILLEYNVISKKYKNLKLSDFIFIRKNDVKNIMYKNCKNKKLFFLHAKCIQNYCMKIMKVNLQYIKFAIQMC